MTLKSVIHCYSKINFPSAEFHKRFGTDCPPTPSAAPHQICTSLSNPSCAGSLPRIDVAESSREAASPRSCPLRAHIGRKRTPARAILELWRYRPTSSPWPACTQTYRHDPGLQQGGDEASRRRIRFHGLRRACRPPTPDAHQTHCRYHPSPAFRANFSWPVAD